MWVAEQAKVTLHRLNWVSWCLRRKRESTFFNWLQELVMERRRSRWKSFKSSMPSDLQSSRRKESRAGRWAANCFRCFLLPEHKATLPTCLWARLCQKDRLYWEKCRRTRLKPRHRGRDLSSSCLKSEQVQRTFSLSLQGRKLKTWSHSSSGSCDTGIASDSGRFPVYGDCSPTSCCLGGDLRRQRYHFAPDSSDGCCHGAGIHQVIGILRSDDFMGASETEIEPTQQNSKREKS